jgi:hypothetical protein
MNELEDKLNALLSNPQLMQQIASMAQNLGVPTQEDPKEDISTGMPSLDPQQMQAIVQAVSQSNVDKNQQALLQALSPYLSSSRIHKLERAMRASKMAGAASLFLNSGGLQLIGGR